MVKIGAVLLLLLCFKFFFFCEKTCIHTSLSNKIKIPVVLHMDQLKEINSEQLSIRIIRGPIFNFLILDVTTDKNTNSLDQLKQINSEY